MPRRAKHCKGMTEKIETKYDRLAQRVRERRLTYTGATQAEMAAASGVSDTTWNNLENGRPVSGRTLMKVSTALGWTAESAALILRGAEPIEDLTVAAVAPSDAANSVDAARLATLEAEMREVRFRLDALGQAQARLELLASQLDEIRQRLERQTED